MVNPLVTKPILINEVNIIDKVGKSKIFWGKVGAKMAKFKSKSKNINLVKLLSTNS